MAGGVRPPVTTDRQRRATETREDVMARVALVTGGTRGIGAAIAKALKAAGHKVAATYCRQ